MRINDPDILAIADLYRTSVLGEAINTSKGSLTGKDLVSALVTTCMSKWFDLTSKFRSRPEVYDVAEAPQNDSYNIVKMTPGADVSGDAFEAITKTTNDIAKELNRLFGKDVFEPRISRNEGKLEALVAFKQAKGGVFQAKGEPSEGHTVIHITMPKEAELERAFSAMTDTPHAADGQGFEDLESDAGQDQVAGEVSPDYDPEFDVPSDVDPSELDDEFGDIDDPMDDLTADEADAMFNDEDEQPRPASRSAFESLYLDSLEALTDGAPEQVQEIFFGRNKKGKVAKDIGQADLVRLVNRWLIENDAIDGEVTYDAFLIGQIPHALMQGQAKGLNFIRITKKDFFEDINSYFNEEEFDWEDSSIWDNEDYNFEIPETNKMRMDFLRVVAKQNWNPVSYWAKEMMEDETNVEPVSPNLTEPVPTNEGKYTLKARHKDGRTRETEVDTGDATRKQSGGVKDQAKAWQKTLGAGWTVTDMSPKEKTIGEQAKPAGFRIRVKGKDGDKTSEIFDTEQEAERARRTKPEYRGGTIEPVMEKCSAKKAGDKKKPKNKKFSDYVKEEAPAVSVGAAQAANSSPAPDVIRDAGKKKKKPLKRTDESLQDMINDILGKDIRFN